METMSRSTSLKGSVFEWFVRRILQNCGFFQVPPDNKIIYRGTAGIMIHGLGQAHNADVLMYPPFQIPLYFPSRLLVECKAHGEKIGLPVVRGMLGLREDINNFEIITPDVLQQRRNYRRRTPASYDYDRFLYQISLATVLGVKQTALEFTMTHKIPILSFYSSSRYQFLRNFLNMVNENYCANLGSRYERVKSYFTQDNNDDDIRTIDENIAAFINTSNELFQHMYVGVTENGNILLLYGEKSPFKPTKTELISRIHWRSNQSEWQISTNEEENEYNKNSLYFELPSKIYNDWANKEFNKWAALDIKERMFSRISVYSVSQGEIIFFILKLNLNFIRDARGELRNDL
jgi:hypothetical protein